MCPAPRPDGRYSSSKPELVNLRVLQFSVTEWVAHVRLLYGVDGLPGGSFDSNLTFAHLRRAGKVRCLGQGPKGRWARSSG